ncbi:MAG: IS66 family insertion sequence element accessory protein TnpB [Desulforegulaceae bacterium]|nr:IS66 family insertion sequence element accessory protein TnpB [Desulforegulaceae bacterium]
MKPKSNRSNADLKNFWKTHISKWEISGLTQAEYCRINNLKNTRFTYWKLKFKKENLPLSVVEISQASINKVFNINKNSIITLHSKSGFHLNIPDDFSSDTLKQILLVLKEV